MLPDALSETLRAVAGAMREARDPWWIIGSAAVCLHGAETSAADVDLLVSERDAALLLDRLEIPVQAGQPDDRFRSRVFARWLGSPLVVEIMAGLVVKHAAGWEAVVPVSDRTIWVGDPAVAIPDRAALTGILRLFGRPKDHRRVAALTSRATEQERYGSPTPP